MWRHRTTGLWLAMLWVLAGSAIPGWADTHEVTGKITRVTGTRVVIDVGVSKGVTVGASGVVWYELVRQGTARRVTVGEVRIGAVGGDTAEATIVKARGAIQPGYFVTLGGSAGVACGGKLEVRTDPPGAEVLIDGKKHDKPTPTTVEKLCYGTRRVTVMLPRHKQVERAVDVRPGPPIELTLPLSLETGDIRISVAPDGATVFIDGQNAGQAGRTPLVLDRVPWGPHRLRVEKPGFVAQELTVDLALPQEAYSFALAPDICAGDLLVSSEPAQAQVLMDGRDVGEPTPAIVRNVRCGTYRVRLTLAGHPDKEEVVEIKNGVPSRVDVAFTKPRGALRVTSAPQGADVYVNDRRVGSAPLQAADVPFGSYRIRVEKTGYTPQERTVVIARPGLTEESFHLREIAPEKVPLLLSTFGYEAHCVLQGVLSLGLLLSEYAVEIADKVVIDWRCRSVDSQKLEIEPGNHRLRVLLRHGFVKAPMVAYEGRVDLRSNSQNEIKVNFLTNTVTINGTSDWFEKDIGTRR